MHDVVEGFFLYLKKTSPGLFRDNIVLEFGSHDINGSVRKYFFNCEYTGLDWRAGPGVDVVSLMHEYDTGERYDVIVTTSAIEHDPYWKKSLERCVDILKVGGSLILTCGGPSYEEHCVETAPITEDFNGKRHYAGIGDEEIMKHMRSLAEFELIESMSNDRDVRLLFYRKMEGR